MKNLLTLLTLMGLLYIPAFGQETESEVKSQIKKQKPVSFMKTIPLRDLLKNIAPVDDNKFVNDKVRDRKEKPNPNLYKKDGNYVVNDEDPVIQKEDGWRDGAGMLKVNFTGQNGSFPPDPTGAAGPEHYVQAVNSIYTIYDKSGSVVTGPYSFSSLWPGNDNDGDPIIMYDRYADRWFISQFQHGGGFPVQPPYSISIAISESSDPLGSYYLYEYSFSSFTDYPKYSVWSNAYFMTANTDGFDCVAYEREKMLTGDPNASMITMEFPAFNQFFNSVAPAYAEGPTAPDATAPGWAFALQDDKWSGVSNDHIKVLKITLDWNTPSNSDVVIHQEIPTAAFDSEFTFSWNDIQQPAAAGGQKLDAVAGIFMYRAQYRRFPDYNTMMLVTTVDVDGTNRAGIRWFELREDNDENWYIHQEGTYAPNDGNSRWMASAAIDLNGNIGLAYCISGPSVNPGIRFTGRFKGDQPGQMTVMEQTAVSGQGVQTGGNRYGDYSQMTVDPADDATFWFTGEYIGNSGARKSRIFSFAMWELLGQEGNIDSTPFFNAYQPSPSEVTILWKNLKDDQFDIYVYNLNGKLVAQRLNIDASTGKETIRIQGHAKGVYLINLKSKNTNLSDKVYFGN